MSQLDLDSTKHYLQVFFRPTESDQLHPDMALHPFDSHREVVNCFRTYTGSPSVQVTKAFFLLPGLPLQPRAFGLADTPPDPTKWHLHVEYEQHRPLRPGVVPTLVIAPHDDYAHASNDFERYRMSVVDRGGRMLYAAIIPPANSGQEEMVIVGRRD